MNKVILLGRLTKDPELRFAAGTGNAVTRFSIAVTRQFKRDEADFINCVAFGKTAETIAQYLTKGSPIAITGNIRTGSYDAQDGTKRYTTDIIVNSITFISDNQNNNNRNQQNSSSQTQNTKPSETNFDPDITPVEDGDMPF